MAWQENLSEDVKEITLYKSLPVYLHGYVVPFVVLYVAILFAWSWLYGLGDHWEALAIILAAVAVLNILLVLSCVWSVHFRAFLTCKKVNRLEQAEIVKVIPTPNNGFAELVPLLRQKHKVTKESLAGFMFQKTKYSLESDGRFQPLQFPIDKSFHEYRSWRGFSDDSEIAAVRMTYGKNRLNITLPDFWELFRERATAPFFVFQVFCVGLWCLDEYWYYSLFTLFMLVTFEAILVKQQQRNLSEIRKMGSQPSPVQAYRGGRWQKMTSEDLLPGDLISVGRSKDGGVVSCDILLLRGSCIVDEAMLTGESVPQMKEPLDDSLPSETLDLARDSRLHIISGGTKVVQHTPPNRAGLRPSDGGCVGYVLRTGFNTSQGKLLRTILYGVKRVTANNLETFIFILFLLVFAIMAAVYVWVKGTEDPARNRYKLFLECTLILTSVVPPELPIELSLAVNTSLIALAKIGIYCTEPFRIPFGGKVDVCCFDKTGTLTSDNLVIKGIAGIDSSSAAGSDGGGGKRGLIPARESPFETQCVLATCHSLALLDGDMVGDPLEKVALSAVDWNLSKGDAVTPKKGRRLSLKIIHRFHFSSSLKRMAVISCFVPSQASGHTHLVTVKGAPEILKEMFSSVPVDYDSLYTKLTRHGARVLALGYKYMNTSSQRQLHNLQRHNVESDLTFAGFLAISCPLKQDSKTNITCLHESSHNVIMLTGDNPLTACHVAKELKISTRKLLVLTYTNEGVWHWQSSGGGTMVPMETRPAELGKNFDLCLTGDAMAYVQSLNGGRTFDVLLPYITVFARVSPKQKESVVTAYRRLGYHTLMCGDGTNDVGALKHAHVGVALLSTVTMQKTTPTGKSSSVDKEDSVPSPSDRRLLRKSLGSTSTKPMTAAPSSGSATPPTAKQIRDKRLRDLLKEMDEASMDPQLVRLGDASIASPFTSRHSSIECICHVIKQGRCTLVTTLQMFKILALNALILAYSHSVLFLDGIKFSDTQATIQGILLAGCFLFISRSRPLTTLSHKRPLPNIFNLYTILTVLLQFLVHFSCLVYLVREAKAELPQSEGDELVDLEKEFEENELNSAVYLISIAMQISNFAVNYKGHPFMASLTENKPLLYSLLATSTVVFVLASGVIPDLSASLEITPFTDEFRYKLLIVLAADFILSYTIDRILSFFLGSGRLKTPPS